MKSGGNTLLTVAALLGWMLLALLMAVDIGLVVLVVLAVLLGFGT